MLRVPFVLMTSRGNPIAPPRRAAIEPAGTAQWLRLGVSEVPRLVNAAAMSWETTESRLTRAMEEGWGITRLCSAARRTAAHRVRAPLPVRDRQRTAAVTAPRFHP